MDRRTLLVALSVGSLPALAEEATAPYPNKAVRIVVNFPPGGTVDVLTRAVAQKMSDRWGQPTVVDNRPGAGGNIGAQVVATAQPDGYTLLGTPPGPMAINQNLYRGMGFDPEKLVPIVMMANVPNAITARVSFPANNVKELIAYIKANPGNVTYGSQGNGSTSHLTGQMFATMIGGDMVHVPFKGEGPALTELLSGRIDLFFGNISAVMKFRETKQVKLLALASAKRGAMAPEVPSAPEAGLPDFLASAWFALVAPPNTPAPLVRSINLEVNEILKMLSVRDQFEAQGAEVVGGTPAEMAVFVGTERARWKAVIKTANVKLD